jgi:YfiR/HmsC-like
MRNANWIALFCAAALALSGSPGHAATEVTVAQLQAVAQTLGFLSNLPNTDTLNIAIVYAQDQSGGEARAAQTAALLNAIRGPNRRTLVGTSVAVKDLGRATQSFDAYFLMPGAPSQGAAINDAVRRHHVISISTDPACLDANCCVLMVSVQGRVRIVLDTALASAAGAQFSSVFAMMVTRK